MECARRELGRIMAYKNPHTWAIPDLDDMKHQYFFLDREMNSKEGDTPLLRLLALHACPKTVENFLYHSDILIGRKPQGGLFCCEDWSKELLALKQVVLQSNYQGVSPLHMALHRNSWYVCEVVRLLLRVDPSLVRRKMTLTGSYPLHVSMANNLTIQSQVLEDLLDADPTVVLEEDVAGDNPVSLLYKNVLRFRWARDWVTQDVIPESMVGDSSWMTVISPDQFRDYSLSMIAAASQGKGEYCNLSWHDICSFPRCSPLLIKVLEMEMPRLALLEPDKNGCLPLHCVAKAPSISNESIPSYILEECSSTLELVMRLEPRAAVVADHDGKFPLHHALENPTITCQVIEQLMEISPVEALMTPDRNTGLLPFQAAAVRRVDEGFETESLIYALLRSEPSATHVL